MDEITYDIVSARPGSKTWMTITDGSGKYPAGDNLWRSLKDYLQDAQADLSDFPAASDDEQIEFNGWVYSWMAND